MGLVSAAVKSPDPQSGAPPLADGILHARIMHARYVPRLYVLRHRSWYLHVRLSDLDRLSRRLIGYNRPRLFSLRDRDYGKYPETLEAWVRRAFESAGVALPDGDISLLTMPRVLGLGFNPVSFWLCRNSSGGLCAVLAEVNNTFGERHCYLVQKDDHSTIGSEDELCAQKVFHVSPFLPVEGNYSFRFVEHSGGLSVRIDLERGGKRVLTATINGTFAPLTDAALTSCFARYLFTAPQVLALIHYHAARLYFRGLKYFPKPNPPDSLVSRSVPRARTNRTQTG